MASVLWTCLAVHITRALCVNEAGQTTGKQCAVRTAHIIPICMCLSTNVSTYSQPCLLLSVIVLYHFDVSGSKHLAPTI